MNEKYQLFESKFHKIVLYAEGQLYLGRAVVLLKTNKASLSHLSIEEWDDFGSVARVYENAVKNCFNATYFNWGCFMNDFFKNKPYQPHVHWHVRPRYENPIEFEGIKFIDEVFGSQFLRKDKELKLSEELLEKILKKMLPHFEM
jgi:diadenosine tetraphosphate (Ap4A) HIT family hydrolase